LTQARTHSAGPTPAPPLWQLLQSTARVVQAVRQGQSATPALAAVPAELRAGTQSLAFQALRQLGRAQALRTLLARRPPPPAVDALLCTALALAWDPALAPYEPFTLVNQAVEAAKRSRATAPQSAFVNGCMRRFLRERDLLVAATDADPVARWNHPDWWIRRLQADHPQHWEALLRVGNEAPPMTLRVNRRRSTPEDYQRRLADVGLLARRVGEDGLVLANPCPVQALPGFDQGLVSVQDAAAQMAAPLLLEGLPPPPVGRQLRILDACAAPGGKTAHLLERADAQVIALDVDPLRCERITQTLSRLGLQARILAADAARPQDWWDGQAFDAILLDAPCTASGIVRRHPDVRWLRRASDIDALAQAQTRLLEALWPLLAPGGRLLYCTCSVFRAEGEARIRSFVAHNTEAVLQAAPGHLLPQASAITTSVPENQSGEYDGFYFARLDKRV
jgi:16S rRNA (cytosine967-C5)-methyltransferase